MHRVSWRTALKRVLSLTPINQCMRAALMPFCRLLPDRILLRVPVAGRVRVTLPNARTFMLETDGLDGIASCAYWRGMPDGFERETLSVFFELLRHTDVFLDVGANTGAFALAAAAESPARTVCAFEAVPSVVRRLDRNRKINRLANLHVVSAAATDYDGSIELCVPSRSGVPTTASTRLRRDDGCRTVQVAALMLDTYVDRCKIGPVDLIKADTEGTEDRVFAGARKLLVRDEPVIICEVLQSGMEDRLQSMLGSIGYRFFHITKEGLVPKSRVEGDVTYICRNYLFATERRMAALVHLVAGQRNKWGGGRSVR